MNDINTAACQCTNCVGAACTCGCQSVNDNSACACSPACQCGPDCQCGPACACAPAVEG